MKQVCSYKHRKCELIRTVCSIITAGIAIALLVR